MNKDQPIVVAFIGCFNPPTNGHIHAMVIAHDILVDSGFIVEKIVMIPSNSGYSKPGLLSGETRCEMCKLATKHMKYVEVDDFESKQEKWPRTINTLEYLSSKYPGTRTMILCGVDLVETFDSKWREPDVIRILEEFGLIVVPRNKGTEDLPSLCKIMIGRTQNVISTRDNPLLTVSSSLVREYINRGHKISGLVDPMVELYIESNKLFS